MMHKAGKLIGVLLLAAALMAGCQDNADDTQQAGITQAATTQAAPEATKAEEKPMETTYSLTSENAKLLGRTFEIEGVLWLSYSASGAEFEYTGTSCKVTFRADGTYGTSAKRARVAVFVNGEQVLDTLIDEKEKTFTVVESSTEQTAVVRIVKLSEVSDSTIGIQSVAIAGSAPVATPEKALKLEFIGDSITCGYGVDGQFGDTYMTANENATKTYAYKTAQLLDADYSMVSQSGYGIYSGYTANGKLNDSQIIPPYYTTMGKSYGKFDDKVVTKNVEWDFTKYVPDIVVINLGTNDSSYCKDNEKRQAYVDAYVEFLKVVREKNPNAKIVCILGIMGDELYPSVEKAVAAYTEETGDTAISSLHFDVQNQAVDGVVVDWHPSEATHTKAAEKLADYLASLLAEE